MKKLGFFIFLATVLMAIFITTATRTRAQSQVISYEDCIAQGKKITICHATSSETNPYVKETISCSAVYGRKGNAGHFDENGTPLAGHEDDVFADQNGMCPGEAVTASPSATPSTSPSTSPSPSPIIEILTVTSPTPTPSTEPSVTPTPNSTPEKETILSSGNVEKCTSNEFDISMIVKDHGTPSEGVLVTFTYNNVTHQAKTNSEGRASVTFTKAGNGTLTAQAEGYPSQSLFITMPMDCQNIVIDPDRHTSGSVLGATTTASASSGKVLGATTLADTGSSQDILSYGMIITGTILVIGSLIHAKKR